MLEEFEEPACELPVMISVTITDRSGRTLSGQTLDAFYVSIRHARPFSVGINCAFGASEMRPYVAELSRIADELRHLLSRTPVCPTPSASTTKRRRTPRGCCANSPKPASLNIVGGCCGTTPDHIRAIGDGGAGSAAARTADARRPEPR